MQLTVLAPQQQVELSNLDTSAVSLVIVDRHLGAWQAVVDKLVNALPESVQVWEWTCDDWGQPVLDRIEQTLQKRPGVLVNAIERWLNNGITA